MQRKPISARVSPRDSVEDSLKVQLLSNLKHDPSVGMRRRPDCARNFLKTPQQRQHQQQLEQRRRQRPPPPQQPIADKTPQLSQGQLGPQYEGDELDRLQSTSSGIASLALVACKRWYGRGSENNLSLFLLAASTGRQHNF